MKKLAALALSLFLLSGTAFAGTPEEADPKPAKPAPPAKPKAEDKSNSAILAEIEALRQSVEIQHEQLQEQHEQLQLLKEELAKRDHQIDEAREEAASANARAMEASSKATEAVTVSADAKSSTLALSSSVAAVKASTEDVMGLIATPANSGSSQLANSDDGPTTIRYKGVNLTPGGFLAAETVTRTRATSSDIPTAFASSPFTANDLSHVTENVFSGRGSRMSLLAQSKVGSVTIGGYYEADFLGAGVTSNNRQTNSYVFRNRQLFAQAVFDSGWIITGGQMWSMATENKKGIFNRQEDTPLQIDYNYVAGFTWARQDAFRVVKDFGGKFALGVSIEGPQATIGGRGFSSVTTINSAAAPATIITSGTTTAVTGNFFLNAPGAAAGGNNSFDATGYTVNKAPDFIFKAAADPSFGHFELFGIVSEFRNRIYPCGVVGTTLADTVPGTAVLTGNCTSATPTAVSSFGAFNDSRTGGGVGASALLPLFNKKLELGLKVVAGDGIGRYGAGQLADATARPDGSLALIRTAHGLGRAEWHATPKLDLYAYWGAEYAWRAGYAGYDAVTVTRTTAIPSTTTTTGGVTTTTAIPATLHTTISTTGIGGYGNRLAVNTGCATEGVPLNDFNPSAGSACAGDTRVFMEPTLGFWYKFYQGPKGRFQFGVQYSYLTRNAWSGAGGVAAGDPSIAPRAVNNMFFTSLRYYIP
jgi:hypothetical protein